MAPRFLLLDYIWKISAKKNYVYRNYLNQKQLNYGFMICVVANLKVANTIFPPFKCMQNNRSFVRQLASPNIEILIDLNAGKTVSPTCKIATIGVLYSPFSFEFIARAIFSHSITKTFIFQ